MLSTVGGKAELLSALFSRNFTGCRRRLKRKFSLRSHVSLFIDIVGYFKLSINEQWALVDEWTEVVRNSLISKGRSDRSLN